MKRLFVVLMMSLIVHVVNAQFCKICHDEDAVISWKTWKHVKYNCFTVDNDEKVVHCTFQATLSLCQHNRFSVLSVRVSEKTADSNEDGVKTLVKHKVSFYDKDNHFNVDIAKKEGLLVRVTLDNHAYFISLLNYPNACDELMAIFDKAKEAKLIKSY